MLLGYHNGTFASPKMYSTGSSSSIAAAVGDFNNDRRLDMAVVSNDTNIIAILYGYDKGFSSKSTYSTGRFPQSVAVGDFNNDTRLDVVVTNYYDNTVSVLLAYANGSFQNQMTFSTGANPYGVTVGDFNNDIILDIVVTNHGDHHC
ncbi:unnamed protein product [Rotaria sordida]|uniref:VCBS repeat-containing protein n=1 Tax=Rotaria sordida TaxID=392033 RepID=A0A820I1A7_9BILA|nr:unnamed protein product [Rotaria sordida]